MPKEIIEVLDTAVKIGLGALISGVSTYAVTQLKNKNDKKRFILERTLERVERATEDAEQYYEAWGSLLRRAGAIARKLEAEEKELSELSKPQKKSLSDRDKVFVESWKNKNSAITIFRLLGAEDVVISIKDAKDLQKDLRKIVVFEKAVPSYVDFEGMRKEFNAFREGFHHAARKLYVQLLNSDFK